MGERALQEHHYYNGPNYTEYPANTWRERDNAGMFYRNLFAYSTNSQEVFEANQAGAGAEPHSEEPVL